MAPSFRNSLSAVILNPFGASDGSAIGWLGSYMMIFRVTSPDVRLPAMRRWREKPTATELRPLLPERATLLVERQFQH